MAANSGSHRVVSLGKRFFIDNRKIQTHSSLPHLPAPALAAAAASASAFRRSVHTSVYDKNLDDHVTPSNVPDDVIQPQSDKYWAPNPYTGVFGPDGEQTSAAGRVRGFRSSSPVGTNGGGESVLEQKAFIRPLEDLEKPEHP